MILKVFLKFLTRPKTCPVNDDKCEKNNKIKYLD